MPPAQNIVLQGDSAGGNLCLALARYLADLKRERGKDLGQPGGMLLFSVSFVRHVLSAALTTCELSPGSI